MLKILRLENYGNINYYKIEYVNNFHNFFINFLDDAGFTKEEILKVDTPFFNLEGEYIFLAKKI